MAQTFKNLPAMQETWVRSLVREDPLEKGVASHSSTISWEIHAQRNLVVYSPWGCKESEGTERALHHPVLLAALGTCDLLCGMQDL